MGGYAGINSSEYGGNTEYDVISSEHRVYWCLLFLHKLYEVNASTEERMATHALNYVPSAVDFCDSAFFVLLDDPDPIADIKFTLHFGSSFVLRFPMIVLNVRQGLGK